MDDPEELREYKLCYDYRDEPLRLKEHGWVRNGKNDGECRYYYFNGSLKITEFYQDGNLQGNRRAWHDNGQLWTQEFLSGGKLHGVRQDWYFCGRIWHRSFYREGKLQGEYKIWIVNGHVDAHEFYRDGTLIDRNFTSKKKAICICLKNKLQSRISGSYNLSNFLIKDLLTAI